MLPLVVGCVDCVDRVFIMCVGVMYVLFLYNYDVCLMCLYICSICCVVCCLIVLLCIY